MRDKLWGSKEEKESSPLSVHDSLQERQNASADDFNSVISSDNRIYFYSAVTRPKILKLNQAIVSFNNTFAKSKVMGYEPPPIKIHINSYGGSVFAALAAIDYIRNSKIEIETVIDGCAASAATMMSVVGHHRSMHKNSCMLIHQLSGGMWGKFHEMKDDIQNSEMLMEKIKNIYREYTKIPEKVLEDILKHDLWWEAEKCLKYGLIDEII